MWSASEVTTIEDFFRTYYIDLKKSPPIEEVKKLDTAGRRVMTKRRMEPHQCLMETMLQGGG